MNDILRREDILESFRRLRDLRPSMLVDQFGRPIQTPAPGSPSAYPDAAKVIGDTLTVRKPERYRT